MLVFYEVDVFEKGKLVNATTTKTREAAVRWLRFLKPEQTFHISEVISIHKK